MPEPDAFPVRLLLPALLGVCLLGLWEALVHFHEIPFYLLPAPSRILATLFQDWNLLLASLLNTLLVTFLAFIIAVLAGVFVAVLFSFSRWVEAAFFPYAVVLQVTPIVSIAPLIIVWIKDTQTALVVCATIVAIFPIISNTTLGLTSVRPELAALFTAHGASRWQTLRLLRAPGALPYFFGGLRISSGLALIGAIVAEFVAGTGGARAGLAYQILQAGYSLNIPRLFAALLLITLAGILLFLLMEGLSRLALGRWHESALRVER